MRAVRILHTSDVHIELEQDAEHLLQLACVAQERAADVMVIVGDFFDHNRVSAATLAATSAALAAARIPIVVLPGNHDPLLAGSPYLRGALGESVQVISAPAGQTIEFPELDLAVWGRPHASYDDMAPLAGIPPRGAAHWQVALAHGHLVRDARDAGRAYLITQQEIASSDRDYVALGHWDVAADVSSGGVTAAYSGSPSRVGICALATLSLDGEGVRQVLIERVSL